METTTVYWGLHSNNGKENGNYYSMLGDIYIGQWRITHEGSFQN